MVELDKRVDEQLPVRVHLRPVAVVLGHLVEGIPLESLAEVAEIIDKRFGVVVEVYEDEAFPHLAAHGDKPVVRLIEVEELTLLLNEREVALEAVTPRVVLAGELATGARHLLTREVAPHQLVSAVPALVVEAPDGLDTVLYVLHDDHRRAGAD